MKIYIHNFRNFVNQTLEFSRINILIGENSGGKSSLLKLLLSLKQTIESPLESNLKLRGDYTDLGNYEEVVKDKDKDNHIKFGFSSQVEYYKYFVDFINNNIKNDLERKNIIKLLNKISENNSETWINFSINSNLNDHKTIKTVIKNDFIGEIVIQSKKIEQYESQRELSSNLRILFKDLEIDLDDCLTIKEGFFTLFDSDIKKKVFELENINHIDIYNKILFLIVFQNFCLDYLEGIRFVNPIGNPPKRLYFQEDKKSSYKLIDIEKLVNILGDPSISKKEFLRQKELLNNVLKLSGIAEEIDIVKNDELPVLALNVKTKGFWSNITDVGYGVSLQLPILFQAILSEKYSLKNETLLIEQPEVHLHPALQSRFIETLLNIGSKNGYFIETHSEHIIRKLQVIVKKKLYNTDSKDITIHYFKRGIDKFEITKHFISNDGKLEPKFPKGFYDNTYNLVKELL